MKILFVLNHFLPSRIAGTEVYVLALCKELKKRNIQTKVVIPNYGNWTTERYFWEGIEVIKYAETSIIDRELIMGKRTPEGVPFFLEVLEMEQPNIVHFQELAGSNGITLQHVKAAKAKGFRTIFTFHLAGYSCKTGNLMYKDEVYCDGVIDIKKCSYCCLTIKDKNSLIKDLLYPAAMLAYYIGYDSTTINSKLGTAFGFPFLIKKLKTDLIDLVESCDKVVALTNWYQEMLIKNGIDGNRISLITQGLAQPMINKDHERRKTKLPLKMVFIGRISSLKGVHLLLQALRGLEINDITLDIFGKSEMDEYYKNCKKESDQLSNVHWRGMIESQEVINELAKYDFLCLPSTFSEMSPLVIQEAFAAGIPVIASNVYGNAEQITDGKNGWLFNFNDSEDLNNKLQMLIDHPGIVEEARENIPEVKSFEKVANEYINLYNQIENSN